MVAIFEISVLNWKYERIHNSFRFRNSQKMMALLQLTHTQTHTHTVALTHSQTHTFIHDARITSLPLWTLAEKHTVCTNSTHKYTNIIFHQGSHNLCFFPYLSLPEILRMASVLGQDEELEKRLRKYVMKNVLKKVRQQMLSYQYDFFFALYNKNIFPWSLKLKLYFFH